MASIVSYVVRNVNKVAVAFALLIVLCVLPGAGVSGLFKLTPVYVKVS